MDSVGWSTKKRLGFKSSLLTTGCDSEHSHIMDQKYLSGVIYEGSITAPIWSSQLVFCIFSLFLNLQLSWTPASSFVLHLCYAQWIQKGRGTRDQTANIHWIIEKAREFQKNIYFCFIDYAKAFVWITTNCGKFFKRWEYQTT